MNSSPVAAPAAVDPLDEAADLLGHVLEVSRVVHETAEAATIWLRVPQAHAAEYVYRPGQFLTVAVPSDRTGWVSRCYSISSSPGHDELAVTVKRTVGGYGSNWLVDNAEPGLRLRVLPARGLFCPRSAEADLLLCAAGSGITPVMSILRAVLESVTGRVALFYANRDQCSVIFDAELAALERSAGERLVVRYWLEAEEGRRPGPADFSEWARPFREREIFICGPGPFTEVIREGAALAGFDTVRIRTEEYRSLTGDPFAPIAEITEESLSDAALVEVTLDDVVHTLTWPSSHTLVDLMVVAGINPPYACREGKCGACTCQLAEGAVDLGRTDALEQEDLDDGFILGCQAKPASSKIKIEF